jgi:hypothetical protein
MSLVRVSALLLGVCVLPLAAQAQGNDADPAPSYEVGFHYAYNSTGESNENGASVYGEYFFKGSAAHLRGRGSFGLIADFSGSGSASGSLYTYLVGIRLNAEWQKSHLVLHSDYKLGAAHVRVNGVNSAGANTSFVRHRFAVDLPAVGLDLRIGHYVITLLQTDFPAMEVPAFAGGSNSWMGDLRVSAGVGYRFDRAR